MVASSQGAENLGTVRQFRKPARVPGWENRLEALFSERRSRPFIWGPHDCASFGIEAVRAVTGEVIYPVTWSTALEALREIERAGGLVAALTKRLGPPSQNWRIAQRGDIGLADMNGREAVVVCTGGTFCGPGIDSLAHLPLSAARLVWRVGREDL